MATPFSPTDWRLSFDGRVSLSPSVGNWNFKCRSHYFITGNRVRWAADMSQKDIDAGRQRDQVAKERQYTQPNAAPHGRDDQTKPPPRTEAPESILSSLSAWLRSLWK
ncbi:DUF6527 family protein [Hydrocarboniphaga sp.]|uniref:DUF6527 family protein n=1 Tax=Hydrocarboniphaga TaxID=243627 RepID=UPI003A10234D